jgi:hypothetical protein
LRGIVSFLSRAALYVNRALPELGVRECGVPAEAGQSRSLAHLVHDLLYPATEPDDHQVVLGDMPEMARPLVYLAALLAGGLVSHR